MEILIALNCGMPNVLLQQLWFANTWVMCVLCVFIFILDGFNLLQDF